jgi:hypothetical protein
MAVSGLVGAGAQDALLEMLAQRRMQEQLEMQARAQQAREQQEAAELSERKRQFDAVSEDRATERRSRDNRAGVEDMERQYALMNQRDPLQDYEARKQIDLKFREPQRDPLEEYEAKKKIDLRYREPKTPSAPQRDPIADYEARKQIDARYAGAGDSGKGQYETEMVERAIEMIGDLRKAAPTSTGPVSILRHIPGTPQRNFSAQAEALKSNLIQNALGEMRANSKTGGAVGQLSEKEAEWLSATQGSLDVGQSPSAFLKQLDDIERRLTKYRNAVNQERMKGIGLSAPPSGGADLIWDGTQFVRPGGE